MALPGKDKKLISCTKCSKEARSYATKGIFDYMECGTCKHRFKLNRETGLPEEFYRKGRKVKLRFATNHPTAECINCGFVANLLEVKRTKIIYQCAAEECSIRFYINGTSSGMIQEPEIILEKAAPLRRPREEGEFIPSKPMKNKILLQKRSPEDWQRVEMRFRHKMGFGRMYSRTQLTPQEQEFLDKIKAAKENGNECDCPKCREADAAARSDSISINQRGQRQPGNSKPGKRRGRPRKMAEPA